MRGLPIGAWMAEGRRTTAKMSFFRENNHIIRSCERCFEGAPKVGGQCTAGITHPFCSKRRRKKPSLSHSGNLEAWKPSKYSNDLCYLTISEILKVSRNLNLFRIIKRFMSLNYFSTCIFPINYNFFKLWWNIRLSRNLNSLKSFSKPFPVFHDWRCFILLLTACGPASLLLETMCCCDWGLVGVIAAL